MKVVQQQPIQQAVIQWKNNIFYEKLFIKYFSKKQNNISQLALGTLISSKLVRKKGDKVKR